MCRRSLLILILAAATIGPAATLARDGKAQESSYSFQTPKPAPKTTPPAQPVPAPRPQPKVFEPYAQAPNVQVGPVIIKAARGSKVAVTSRTTRVTVIGVDGENIEATATSEAGQEPVQTQVTGDPAHPKISVFVPANHPRRAGKDVHLSIKVPRY